MTTTVEEPVYGTKLTQPYIERRAAREAGGAPIDLLSCTVVLGDGNGAVPPISDLLTAGGVLHEVWRGATIASVTPNATNPAQFDIKFIVPAATGGVEVGPFWVREFALVDPDGVALVVGITNFQKSTSAEGQASDMILIAGIAEANGDVLIVTPPSSSFQTDVDVRNLFNANLPDSTGAIEKTDTIVSGWIRRVFSLRKARQPSNVTGAVVLEPDGFGGGRPATDAEFDAGEAAAGSFFTLPWPTLQQIKRAIAAILPYDALLPLVRNDAAKRYEIIAATRTAWGIGRRATLAEVAARATNTNIAAGGAPGPAFIHPEDLPPDPNGVGIGARMKVPAKFTGAGAMPLGSTITGEKFLLEGQTMGAGALLLGACLATAATETTSIDFVWYYDSRRGQLASDQTWMLKSARIHYVAASPTAFADCEFERTT